MDTTSIGKRVRKKKHKSAANNIPYIPDDLILNILTSFLLTSYLHADLFARDWRNLTSDPDFVHLQFTKNSNFSTILVVNLGTCSTPLNNLIALDNWWEPTEERLTEERLTEERLTVYRFPLHAIKFSRALFSHAGLLVFQINQFCFIILNPTNGEYVRITTLSKEIGTSKIFGVYFHPSLKKYCSLWMINGQYKMLTLGSNPSLKNLSNPFSNRFVKMGHESSPLFINNFLYLMLEPKKGYIYCISNDIMEFDIISEEFTVIPCPVLYDINGRSYQTRPVNIDGILSLLLVRPRKITIWRMEDCAPKKFGTAVEYTVNIQIQRPMAIVMDGKLALWSKGDKLRVYNLMEGSVKKYQKTKYGDNIMFLSHQMSLASLRNYKPTIFINKDGQLVA